MRISGIGSGGGMAFRQLILPQLLLPSLTNRAEKMRSGCVTWYRKMRSHLILGVALVVLRNILHRSAAYCMPPMFLQRCLGKRIHILRGSTILCLRKFRKHDCLTVTVFLTLFFLYWSFSI